MAAKVPLENPGAEEAAIRDAMREIVGGFNEDAEPIAFVAVGPLAEQIARTAILTCLATGFQTVADMNAYATAQAALLQAGDPTVVKGDGQYAYSGTGFVRTGDSDGKVAGAQRAAAEAAAATALAATQGVTDMLKPGPRPL